MSIDKRLGLLEKERKAAELSAIQIRYYTVDYATGERVYSEPDEGDLFLEEWARQLVERGRQVAI